MGPLKLNCDINNLGRLNTLLPSSAGLETESKRIQVKVKVTFLVRGHIKADLPVLEGMLKWIPSAALD